MHRPLIGITPDVVGPRLEVRHEYGELVAAAGGLPVVLAPGATDPEAILDRLDGIVLSGGDDPAMERWGIETHPRAKPLDSRRQAFELALLERLDARPEIPVLGICLGMQLMALHRGGRLDQHLPDRLPTAADHWGRRVHAISGPLGCGEVLSHHRQAIVEPGGLDVVATAPDGVIEAVADTDRPCYLGVQWHPERTGEADLGAGLFERLVTAARGASA